ncbi:MAG: hypothetical protein LBT51_01925 [Fusobacteriaceae bacterium]|jgi:hypothetical protein|nr:hypothetical protein [Fusobacteriaceae bacterium]
MVYGKETNIIKITKISITADETPGKWCAGHVRQLIKTGELTEKVRPIVIG